MSWKIFFCFLHSSDQDLYEYSSVCTALEMDLQSIFFIINITGLVYLLKSIFLDFVILCMSGHNA